MYMKMSHTFDESPRCTSSCVARCGSLAELPRTEASQLVGCFEETCGCVNKWADDLIPQEEAEADSGLMRQYFDMIHNQERVEYLMLQQNVIDRILSLED